MLRSVCALQQFTAVIYLVMNISILRLHDLGRAHLCVGHPFNVIGLLDLTLGIIVLGVLQVQVMDQETLDFCRRSFGECRVCSDPLLGLVIYVIEEYQSVG